MKKSEIFDLIIDKVCEVCEVRKETLLGGNRMQAVVDARVLAVQYLRRIGLTNDEIALLVIRWKMGDASVCPDKTELKKKSKTVNNLFRLYSERCMQSFSFCLMSKELKEFCRTSYEPIYIYGMKELPSK